MREKGTYSLEKSASTTKFYRGKPVLIVKDIMQQMGISKGAVRNALLSRCARDEDYVVVDGDDLADFKAQNGMVGVGVHWLYLIYVSGVEKLLKYFKGRGLVPVAQEWEQPAVKPAEKLTKTLRGDEGYRIEYSLEVLHKLISISKERELDITLKPFEAHYSVLYRNTVGIQETLPIHGVIYELAFELVHSILHKNQHGAGNQAFNQRAHQTAISFIQTLDVLSTP